MRTARALAAFHELALALVHDRQHWQCIELVGEQCCKLARYEQLRGADDWTREHWRYLRNLVNYSWARHLGW